MDTVIMFFAGAVIGGLFVSLVLGKNEDFSAPASVLVPRNGKLKFIESENGQWRWKLLAGNNKSICGPGERFNNKADAEDIALSIIVGEYSNVEVEYQHYQHKN